MANGKIYGKNIRDEFHCPHSSLVISIFRLLPFFRVEKGPYIILNS